MALVFVLLLTSIATTTSQRWAEHQGMWYFFPPEEHKKSFYDAWRYCNNMSSQLVTITTEDQNDFVESNIQSESWIGYYHNNDNYCGGTARYPKWTDDPDCSLTYRNNLGGRNYTEGYAVTVSKDGLWTKSDVLAKHNLVCQWQCPSIIVENERYKVKANGIYTLKGYYNNRKYYSNLIDFDIVLFYYAISNAKLWVIGENLSGAGYYYVSQNYNYRYVPDTWNIPTDWRRNADFKMFCRVCHSIDIEHNGESGLYSGTYHLLREYADHETCNGSRSKLYKKNDINVALYLYVADENGTAKWFIGSDNCSDGWRLYNTDYAPLPCMLSGVWIDRPTT